MYNIGVNSESLYNSKGTNYCPLYIRTYIYIYIYSERVIYLFLLNGNFEGQWVKKENLKIDYKETNLKIL